MTAKRGTRASLTALLDISFLNPQEQTCCRHHGIEDLDTFVNTSAGGGLGVYT